MGETHFSMACETEAMSLVEVIPSTREEAFDEVESVPCKDVHFKCYHIEPSPLSEEAIDGKVDNVPGDDDTFNAVINHVMEGLVEQFISSPNVVADQVEGNIGGFVDTTGSNGVDDDILEGVDVKSSNIVGDDSLAKEMVGVENEIIVPTVVEKDNEIITKVTSLNPLPTIQAGCKARLTGCSDACGILQINMVHLEHNHKTSPSKSRLNRCNRQLSEHVKGWLEVNDIAGIPLHKSFNSTVVETGGFDNMTCVEKDYRNFIEKVRCLRLGEGDALAIQAYFAKMQSCSPGFFFSMDLDDDCRLRNVFWAEKRCREAYKEFGHVVTFDTTYLTNKYNMPFAPFVGVNHHGQSTLLSCGLVSNEYVWCFRTWLECMNGQAPNGIITDQDRAMQNAIQIVFPKAKHRLSLWHILKKFPEKFGYHIAKGPIMHARHVLVYDTLSCEEFEDGWLNMLDQFELRDHDWLSGLYEERSHWVPCFLNTTFWADMSTT
ncbi:protein FAR1-RELATED SEQUENCE 5-like [Olea europaea var. sylvestris]|uniref:protein FAR1-RELATED SEQUENCE 5-like n=1 Tax=Olea europaea var. sylvestris TaxID=158386 RepID=UPI000C1D815F|nr:protein FAR1-RELATED SEQUENCE 5-like [Olea europaea var. sylvestris]